MDDDVRQAFEELRGELEDAKRARTPAARQEAQRDVREARVDLEDVLRAEGYRLTRRELDSMMEEREDAKFRARLDRELDRIAKEAEEAEAAEHEGEGEGEGEGAGSSSSSSRRRPRRKPATTTGGGSSEEEEEWK